MTTGNGIFWFGILKGLTIHPCAAGGFDFEGHVTHVGSLVLFYGNHGRPGSVTMATKIYFLKLTIHSSAAGKFGFQGSRDIRIFVVTC